MPGRQVVRFCFVCFLVGLGLSLPGCAGKTRPQRGRAMRKPRDIPEQRIAGEPEATGEYLADCRRELRAAMREVFADIAHRVLAGQEEPAPEVIDRALAYYDRYFQVTKGNTNLRREDVLEAIQLGQRRQRALHAGLIGLADRFARQGVQFRIAEAGHFEKKILWEGGIEAGYRIVTDHETELFAYPLISMKTSEYMVPRAGPVAAGLVYLDADGMIFLRHGEDPGEAFARAAGEIFGKGVDVGGEIEGVHLARLYEHRLEIVALKDWALAELEDLRKIYRVPAVVGGDPHDFTAVILIDPDLDLPVLLRGEED